MFSTRMEYTIEISFDTRKHHNITTLKGFIEEQAYTLGCQSCIHTYEMEPGSKIIGRNHCVLTVIFNKIEEAAHFIKKMRQTSGVHIECVYKDDGKCEILHASPHYLSQLHKRNALDIRNKCRNNKSSTDSPIIRQFYKISPPNQS